MQVKTNRFEWVDYAKAIGILLVVYGHVARGLVSAGIMPDSIMHQYVDSVIYTFHMPLFFFLSGLFLITSFQTKGFGQVFGSKIDTIIYPYIIWSLFQGGVEVVLSSYTNASVTVYDVASLLTSPRAQFWFLYALFLVFLTSLFVLKFVGVKALNFAFILSVIFYLWLPKIDFNMGFISSNLVFFLAGAVFQQAKLIRFNTGFVVCAMSLFAIVGQYLFHKTGYTYENKSLFLLCLSVLSLLAIASLSEWLSHYNLSFMAYLGASSMAIYLMHILAGSGTRVIISKGLGVDSLSVHLLLGTLLGTMLPLLALNVIKYFKIPYIFSLPVSRYWLPIADKSI
jgi:fucose 4-O-acetylase-like acetyltransferase